MAKQQENIADRILSVGHGTRREAMSLVWQLSIPAILAELSSIAMQYIDAAMVGNLGAEASAAIGLVSTSTWLFGGICGASAVGFSVQIAHAIGARDEDHARSIRTQGILTCILIGLVMSVVGLNISGSLPVWLGGKPEILGDASSYFRIFSVGLTFMLMRRLSGHMLQCSGDMKTPSVLNILLCVLDVLFNAIFIHMGMGVSGAALGTVCAEVVISLLMLGMVLFRSPVLHLRGRESIHFEAEVGLKALKIAAPMAAESVILNSAQIAITKIVAPLGTIAVAANSLAVTAESLCYMPGYGIGSAATTLVGQSLGAKEKKAAKRFAHMSVLLGMLLMGGAAVLMFLFADQIFLTLTSDPEVRVLGSRILRIEAFAEPLFAASICTAGALRGAGDTLIPSILNLVSMWGVRITMSAALAPHFGLVGVWIAMASELSVRGILFLIRLLRGRWLQQK